MVMQSAMIGALQLIWRRYDRVGESHTDAERRDEEVQQTRHASAYEMIARFEGL